MTTLRTSGNLVGPALIVVGTAIFIYLEFTDRSDPDYSPPVFVVATIAGFWVAVFGVVLMLFSCITRFLGERVCLLLGLCLIALGIAKIFVLDLGLFETWRVAPRVTISFDLIGVSFLSLGVMLSFTSGTLRSPPAKQGVDSSV